MEIYLIRHTTPKVEKGICYGQSDLELANSFTEEVELVLKQLPKQFDVVYSSPLKRCKQLAKKIDQNCISENRLMELNFGDWEMQKWDDIPLSEIQPWYADFVNTPALNGESYIALNVRVLEFYNSVVLNSKHQKIAIVTHSGVIRSLLAKIRGIALEDSFNLITINYGSVVKIKTR